MPLHLETGGNFRGAAGWLAENGFYLGSAHSLLQRKGRSELEWCSGAAITKIDIVRERGCQAFGPHELTRHRPAEAEIEPRAAGGSQLPLTLLGNRFSLGRFGTEVSFFAAALIAEVAMLGLEPVFPALVGFFFLIRSSSSFSRLDLRTLVEM